MAVVRDAVGPAGAGGNGSQSTGTGSFTNTYAHIVGSGANRVVVAQAAFGNENGSDAGVTLSATFGGVAMTSLGIVHDNNQANGFVELFGLIAPPAGSQTVVVTAAGTLSAGDNTLVCGSISYTGADQLHPFGTPHTSLGSGASISVVVPSAAGHVVVDVAANGSPITGTSQTLGWINNFEETSAAGNAASSDANGATSVTMGYTANADWWGIVAVDIAPFAGMAGKTSAASTMTGTLTAPSPALTGAARAASSLTGTLTVPFPFITGVSSDHRYLVNQAGAPYLVNGDSAWNLVGGESTSSTVASGLSAADQITYLNDRVTNGFNTILISVGSGWDQAGNSPGTFGSSSYTPGTAYWNGVDTLLQACAARGISVVFDVLDAYYFGNSGNAFVGLTTGQATAYGTFLATRFPQASYPGIVWFLGNDYAGGVDPVGNGNTENLDALYEALLAAIVAAGDTRLTTIELGLYESLSTDSTEWIGRVSFNNVYSYHPTYEAVIRARAVTTGGNPLPALFVEAAYEQNISYPRTELDLRKVHLWPMTSGACGTFYGNDSLWPFGTGWQAQLDTTIVSQRQALVNVFAGLKWWELAPDTASALVTAGRNTEYVTFSNTVEAPLTNDATYGNYVSAAVTADKSLAVVYNPDSSINTTVTIATAALGSSPTLTRVDPTTGIATPVTFTTSLTNPGANAGGDHDWLYIIEATSTTVPAALAGNTAARSAAAGALTSKATLAGATAVKSTIAAALKVAVPLAGSIRSATGLTGTLTVSSHLAGATAGATSLTGSLTQHQAIAGTTSAAGTLTGLLTDATAGALQGAIAARSALTGSLSVAQPIVASTAATSGLDGSLRTAVAFAASMTAASNLTGTLGLAGAGTLAGRTDSRSGLTATLGVGQPLAGTVGARATLTGALAIAGPAHLQGATAATSTLTGRLTAVIPADEAISISVGQPYTTWSAGPAYTTWSAGPARSHP